MADHANTIFVHIVHPGKQVESGVHVGDTAIVAEFVAFDGDVSFRRPSVEYKRDNEDVTSVGECLAVIDGEGGFLHSSMGDG